ncbi:hypothetical protein Tco_1093836 [Tanacetum coccineum]|uniref:Uncharacterized protein n=1 Tax=Tanacetum coccineum TaxID=301880 RepID=A0ABQ5IG61_9ASTR
MTATMETPLIDITVDCFIDFKGPPAVISKSDSWRSTYFIIGVEVAERFRMLSLEQHRFCHCLVLLLLMLFNCMILPADHVLRAVINARLSVPLLLLVCFWSYLFHVVMLPYQVGDVSLTWSAAVLLSSS